MRKSGTIVTRQILFPLFLCILALTACQPRKRADLPIFVDANTESGLDFVHVNGMNGGYLFPEIQGPGVALFDYDNDGDLDVYLVQGGYLEDTGTSDRPTTRLIDRLYRNDLVVSADGSRHVRLHDVTVAAGLDASRYGMGVTTGDYDNDGDIDLYLSNFGDNQLWRNNGDGTFSEVGEESGTGDSRWSHSAVFVDIDRDGWLDLLVVNYVDFRLGNRKACSDATGAMDYCGPFAHAPVPDRLYRNLGDGRFEDISAKSGLRQPGSGLGVVSGDFNQDGWPDLYVANDAMPNHLWINQGDGRFLDDALMLGTAVNSEGQPEASMGVVAGDVDGDGDEDLFMTHLREETNTLYVNDGNGGFREKSIASGLAAASRGFTGFGAALLDFDLDGWLDVVVVNGAVRAVQSESQRRRAFPYGQPNQLFRNQDGHYIEISDQVPVLAFEESSRGLAAGDIDNDGDPDLIIANANGPARLLLNTHRDAEWLGLRLIGKSGRDAIGASVTLRRADGRPMFRRVRVGGSYLSAGDPRLLFGLAGNAAITGLAVAWPDGSCERWSGLALNRYHELVQGKGGTTDKDCDGED
jgi:hypothetical protein